MKQSELKAILEDHKLWIQSDYKQGKRANLQGVHLASANLQDVILRGANLQGADLRGANLPYADLRCAHLLDVDLEDADLESAYLRGAYLTGAKFSTNFKKVAWFDCATFSKDQIPWVVLHPKYPVWAYTLKWVKAESK